MTRPARSAGTSSHLAARDAMTPAAQRTQADAISLPSASVTPSASQRTTARPSTHLDAEPLELRSAPMPTDAAGNVGSSRSPASTSTTRAVRASMLRKSSDDRLARQFGDGAGKLDAGRAAADHDEGQQLAALVVVLGDLGLLEGRQDAGPDFGRVADRLQAGRRIFPFVMSEIGMPRAGGDRPGSRRRCARFVGDDAAAWRIDALDLLHQHGRVLLRGQDAPDRHGDLRGREPGRRHLIEQRLEQMVVAAVDDGDVDIGALRKPIAAFRPPKPAPRITTRGRRGRAGCVAGAECAGQHRRDDRSPRSPCAACQPLCPDERQAMLSSEMTPAPRAKIEKQDATPRADARPNAPGRRRSGSSPTTPSSIKRAEAGEETEEQQQRRR